MNQHSYLQTMHIPVWHLRNKSQHIESSAEIAAVVSYQLQLPDGASGCVWVSSSICAAPAIASLVDKMVQALKCPVVARHDGQPSAANLNAQRHLLLGAVDIAELAGFTYHVASPEQLQADKAAKVKAWATMQQFVAGT